MIAARGCRDQMSQAKRLSSGQCTKSKTPVVERLQSFLLFEHNPLIFRYLYSNNEIRITYPSFICSVNSGLFCRLRLIPEIVIGYIPEPFLSLSYSHNLLNFIIHVIVILLVFQITASPPNFCKLFLCSSS